MTRQIENLINLLAQKSINYYDFISKASDIAEITELFEPKDLSMWRALGIEIIKLDNGKITLKTRETDISDEIFASWTSRRTAGSQTARSSKSAR